MPQNALCTKCMLKEPGFQYTSKDTDGKKLPDGERRQVNFSMRDATLMEDYPSGPGKLKTGEVQRVKFLSGEKPRASLPDPEIADYAGIPKGVLELVYELIGPAALQMNRGDTKDKATGNVTKPGLDTWLNAQPHFAQQSSILKEYIEETHPGTSESGIKHICLMLPKFHCELNGIERTWAMAKQYLRSECEYTYPALCKNAALSLGRAVISETQHRHMSRKVRDWVRAYAGKTPAGEFHDEHVVCEQVKKLRTYRSHRGVGREAKPLVPWEKKITTQAALKRKRA
jgi:transposase